MPPKTITCCECGEQVLKSQTYATGKKDENGDPLRACKIHEGVIEQAEKLKERKKIKPVPKKEKKFNKPWGFEDVPLVVQWNASHCWLCESEGMSRQHHAQAMLITLAKAKQDGQNADVLFDPKKLKKYLPRDIKGLDLVVLDLITLNEETLKRAQIWKRIKRDLMDIISIGGIIQLCPECQDRMDIKVPEIKTPKPEVMYMLGSIYEDSQMKKNIDTIAKGELAEDFKRNLEKN